MPTPIKRAGTRRKTGKIPSNFNSSGGCGRRSL